MRPWSAKCAYYVCSTNILSARKTASACRPPGKSFRRHGVKRAAGFPHFPQRSAPGGRGVMRPWYRETVSAMQSNFYGESFSSKRFSARPYHFPRGARSAPVTCHATTTPPTRIAFVTLLCQSFLLLLLESIGFF